MISKWAKSEKERIFLDGRYLPPPINAGPMA